VTRYWVALPGTGDIGGSGGRGGAGGPGGEVEVEVEGRGGRFRVTAAGGTHAADLIEVVPGVFTLIVDGRCHDLQVTDAAGGRGRVLMVDGALARPAVARTPRRRGTSGGEAAAGAEVRAPMPGLLVAVHAAPGARVELGEAVAIMEAMKMQMEIRAPQAGTVARVHVRAGQELAAGQLLMTME
jgi:biotin carboxyl carrier protein